MSDWYMGALARQDLPPEFNPPEQPPQPGIIERTLPKVYDPLQQQQQEVAKQAIGLTPIGSIADMVDAYQSNSPWSFGLAAAAAVPAGKVVKGAKAAKEAVEAVAPEIFRPNVIEKYVTDPLRIANPGVYKRPDEIARSAAEKVDPEHPALKALFGVTRQDLYDISQQGRRKGNIEPSVWQPSRGDKVNYAAEAVMSPQNAQRLIDTLAEARKYPELIKGMDPWYVMDPAFQRMVQLVGREQAIKDYNRFNYVVSPFSAGSSVPVELNRGTAAHMYAARGDFPIFQNYAGLPETLAKNARPGAVSRQMLGEYFPNDLRDVMGHAYHGVQHDPVARWLATGEHGYNKDTVKIPLYTQASGVPETGFQTRLPVPDAHFTRAIGVPDVRRSKDFNDYMGGTEYRPIGPWFREQVAKPLGIEAVPAQARMWGTYSQQTGVDTPIGAGKLELLSKNIWERAQRLGIDPMKLRDDVLMGKEHALWILGLPTAGAAAAKMGGVADQGSYEQ